jgi:hypothetical protein
MELSIPQIALMSRLLDEALPLDVARRGEWLERLPPDLAPALREALLYELIRLLGAGGMAEVWLAGAPMAPSGARWR